MIKSCINADACIIIMQLLYMLLHTAIYIYTHHWKINIYIAFDIYKQVLIMLYSFFKVSVPVSLVYRWSLYTGGSDKVH